MANIPLEELVDSFLKKGGRINKHYSKNLNVNRHTMVYLNGWFTGPNIRTAITKALLAK